MYIKVYKIWQNFTNSMCITRNWKFETWKEHLRWKKNIIRQKWLRKIHLKNVEFTYKSLILKFKIQQKVSYKKRSRMIHLNVQNFLYTNKKLLFWLFKMQKTCNILKKNQINLGFLQFFHSKYVFRK